MNDDMTSAEEDDCDHINLDALFLDDDVAHQGHYESLKSQPIDYIIANDMDFLEGNVIKYVSRYKGKDGVRDLRKARQYLDWLIEREEGKTCTPA